MYIVTLEQAKKQLYRDVTYTDDDDYIERLINISFLAIKNTCRNHTWIDTSGVTEGSTEVPEVAIYGTVIPEVITQAILLCMTNMYENRSPVSFSSASTISYTLDWLIQPYINFAEYTTTTTTSVV